MRGARVELRPETPEDRGLLYEVFASARGDEFAVAGLDERTIATLLRSQFEIQDRAYRQEYPDAVFSVVVVDGVPAGRVYTAERSEEIRLIEIALMPEFRGRGIGTRLLRELQLRAERRERPLRLSVARTNHALRLYRRLGFRETRADEVYAELEWRARVS
jgi:ribosomal protein S18 acetylase RimI-like enzyme